MKWATGVVALVLGSAVVGGNAMVTKRPLDHRIKHFEPLSLSRHHLRRSLEDPRPVSPFSMPVVAFNTSFDLKLSPAVHLFSDQGAWLTTTNEKGEKVREKIDTAGFYTGRLGNQAKDQDPRATFVHVTIRKDGTMQGMFIDKHGEGYHIDPAHEHFDEESESAEFDHVIYRESDIEYKGGSAGALHSPGHTEDVRPPKVDETMYGEAVDPAFEAVMQGKAATWAGPKKRARRSDEAVHAHEYTTGSNVCHVALWADKEFAEEYGGTSGAIVKMLQRFSIANQIFVDDDRFQARHVGGSTSSYDRGGSTVPVAVTMQISEVAVESTVSLSPGDAAEEYLKTFGLVESGRSTDWSKVCLATGFTYRDYSGTLGLAWTAKPLSYGSRWRRTTNGGICTAQYTNTDGLPFSTNTNMVTSKNFGSKQPELQISLVLAHEYGHNFGAPHDLTEDQSGYVEQPNGDNLMYPYSVTGAETNNHIFSAESMESMNAVLGDAAGCFLVAATGCGNFIQDGDDECDCGGSTVACEAVGDSCCNAECKLTGGVGTCSPLDQQHGLCCSDECAIQAGSTCKEQSVCQAAAVCSTAGKCPSVAGDRPENSLCQESVTLCQSGRCSGLCDNAGGCTKSICSLWNQVECDPGYGYDEGCKVKCKASSLADDSTCKTPAELGTPATDAYGATNELATPADYAVTRKAAGSTCEYISGMPSSGLCSPDGNCYDANTEEDLMAQLNELYDWALETFTAWCMRTDVALPNYVWLIIGFVVTMLACCGMCYVGNHPQWSAQLASCCGCYHESPVKVQPGIGEYGNEGLTTWSTTTTTTVHHRQSIA